MRAGRRGAAAPALAWNRRAVLLPRLRRHRGSRRPPGVCWLLRPAPATSAAAGSGPARHRLAPASTVARGRSRPSRGAGSRCRPAAGAGSRNQCVIGRSACAEPPQPASISSRPSKAIRRMQRGSHRSADGRGRRWPGAAGQLNVPIAGAFAQGPERRLNSQELQRPGGDRRGIVQRQQRRGRSRPAARRWRPRPRPASRARSAACRARGDAPPAWGTDAS